MKLKDAIGLGKACGLETVEECVCNIDIHCMSLFVYAHIDAELKELHDEYKASTVTGDDYEV
jgi:hypothetical protein